MDAAGLITYPFADRGLMDDANSTFKMGVYRGHAGTLNTPAQYGLFLVLLSIDYVVQVYFPSYNMNAVPSWRIYSPHNNEWSPWDSF